MNEWRVADKVGLLATILVTAVGVIMIVYLVIVSLDEKHSMEGRYCLVINGSPVPTQCIDRSSDSR